MIFDLDQFFQLILAYRFNEFILCGYDVNLLDKLQNTNRLYVLLLFPVIGILFFGVIGVKDKVHFVGEMTQVEKLTKLTIQITALVHQTQIERGKTSVYMYSLGTEFTEKLPTQYPNTDKLLDNVAKQLIAFNIPDNKSDLQTLLTDVINALEQISTVRRDAMSLNIPMQNGIDYYSDLNAKFLKIVSVLPTLSDESNFSRLSNTYINLLKGKEKAGLERAIISGILTAHRFSPQLYLQEVSVAAQQQMYFDNFILLAPSQYLALFEQAELSVDREKVSAIREHIHQQIFQDNLQGSAKSFSVIPIENGLAESYFSEKFQPNVSQWFTHSSNRINALKEVEDSIATDLLAQTQQAKFDAFYSLVFYSILVFMAIVMALVIPIIFKKLQRSRKNLDKNINELNLEKRKVSVRALRRKDREIDSPSLHTILLAGDILVLQGKPRRVERVECYLLDGTD